MWIRGADQLLLELRRNERFTNEVGETYWGLERVGLSDCCAIPSRLRLPQWYSIISIQETLELAFELNHNRHK